MPSVPEPLDETLAARAADGGVEAFEALVVRHGGAVIAALERMLGDHHLALDAAQEVWIKVHRNLGGYRRGAAFRPWLFAIALNHGRDQLRRRGRRPTPAPLEFERTEAPHWSDPSGPTRDRDAIAAALAGVEPTFREALVLVDVLGLGHEEAAVALDCAIGTVKSRVHRGRQAFRAAWERCEARGADPETTTSVRNCP